jgi:hypothetical protein
VNGTWFLIGSPATEQGFVKNEKEGMKVYPWKEGKELKRKEKHEENNLPLHAFS